MKSTLYITTAAILLNACSNVEQIKLDKITNPILDTTIGKNCNPEGIPKTSSIACTQILLVSSEVETNFYVDSIKIGQGKRLKVMIEKEKSYKLIAHPPNCEEKIEIIDPPYRGSTVNFTFTLEECNQS